MLHDGGVLGVCRRTMQGWRCEGRKPFGAKPGDAEVVAYILELRRKPKGGERLSFQAIPIA